MASRFALFAVFALFCFLSCSISEVTRIGPAVPSRGKDCGIEILKEGEKPSRPYRDIGMVSLNNCESYLTPPCVGALKAEACALGGHVAYLPEKTVPDSEIGPVVYRVMVAAYVAEVDALTGSDPLAKSRTCTPKCEEGETCMNRECRPFEEAAGCDSQAEESLSEENHTDKCLE